MRKWILYRKLLQSLQTYFCLPALECQPRLQRSLLFISDDISPIFSKCLSSRGEKEPEALVKGVEFIFSPGDWRLHAARLFFRSEKEIEINIAAGCNTLS